MIKLTLISFVLISFLSGCVTGFLPPSQAMGVEQPKIHFKKTRTSLEASASSNFTGDLLFDGEYDKDDKNFKGRLEAHVNSDASTVTESQVEKIKAMENAYNKYSDNMTALGIAQAQAWQKAFESITQIIPGTVGALKSNSGSDSGGPLENVMSIFNSLTPEQKNALFEKLKGIFNQNPAPTPAPTN